MDDAMMVMNAIYRYDYETVSLTLRRIAGTGHSRYNMFTGTCTGVERRENREYRARLTQNNDYAMPLLLICYARRYAASYLRRLAKVTRYATPVVATPPPRRDITPHVAAIAGRYARRRIARIPLRLVCCFTTPPDGQVGYAIVTRSYEDEKISLARRATQGQAMALETRRRHVNRRVSRRRHASMASISIAGDTLSRWHWVMVTDCMILRRRERRHG